MASTRRKSAAVALALVGVAGLTLASAAQLNVNSASLGAGTAVVASCQPTTGPAIAARFTPAYAAAVQGYTTTSVTLSDVAAACDGLNVSITVVGADGTSLATAPVGAKASTGSSTYTLSGAVDVKNITGVSVVISG